MSQTVQHSSLYLWCVSVCDEQDCTIDSIYNHTNCKKSVFLLCVSVCGKPEHLNETIYNHKNCKNEVTLQSVSVCEYIKYIIMFYLAINLRLQAYGSLTLETIAFRKGTTKTNTTINKQFMVDLNIPSKAESQRDLLIPTMMLEQHFTVLTPGADTIKYRDSLQNIIDNNTSEENNKFFFRKTTNFYLNQLQQQFHILKRYSFTQECTTVW